MRAAVEVAAACGIPVSEPALLQETNNTAVWLRPSPVVAKVATRPDSKLDVRREHAVGSELATLGAEIAVPLPNLQPVEHPPTGFVVTLWERLERVDTGVAEGALSDSLAGLHAALAKTRTNLPSFREELTRARLALDDDTFMAALGPADRTFLRYVYDAGLAELGMVDQVLAGQRPARYHLVSAAHDHLVCKDCAAIIDVPAPVLDRLRRQLDEGYGFAIAAGRTAVVGRCRDCIGAGPAQLSPVAS